MARPETVRARNVARGWGLVAGLVLLPAFAVAAELAADLGRRVDALVLRTLHETGAPSAAVAIVREGSTAYARAYGCARLHPCVRATPARRYEIGSISKEFTAVALLLLEQEGRLSLEDPVAKYFPAVTRGADVSLRALLSHTAGVHDFWPQDYALSIVAEPISPAALIERFASGPLDFEPGTRWQYSNTGYTIAGAIAERVAGEPLVEYLRRRVFDPLHMSRVVDADRGELTVEDAAPYTQYALGPARPAPPTAAGWLYGAGELGMSVEDLARWDAALMDERLLPSALWRKLEHEVQLASGVGSGYALGLYVRLADNRRLLEHTGEVPGFATHHRLYPEERLAVIVFTNTDVGQAADTIVARLSALLLEDASREVRAERARAQATFVQLQHGRIRREWMTSECNRYFSALALGDFARSLGSLGAPRRFELKSSSAGGGFITREYRVRTAHKTLAVVTRATPLGRFEQYTVSVE
jgi:CubicO group peptidase (beta-lactamase class C family)